MAAGMDTARAAGIPDYRRGRWRGILGQPRKVAVLEGSYSFVTDTPILAAARNTIPTWGRFTGSQRISVIPAARH